MRNKGRKTTRTDNDKQGTDTHTLRGSARCSPCTNHQQQLTTDQAQAVSTRITTRVTHVHRLPTLSQSAKHHPSPLLSSPLEPPHGFLQLCVCACLTVGVVGEDGVRSVESSGEHRASIQMSRAICAVRCVHPASRHFKYTIRGCAPSAPALGSTRGSQSGRDQGARVWDCVG